MKVNRLPKEARFHNDSALFVVRIDDRFGYVESREAAEAVSKTACPEDIGSSAHGYICIYPPNAKAPQHKNRPILPFSQLQPIDILGYAQKHGQRYWARDRRGERIAGRSTLPQRLESYKLLKEYTVRNPNDSWDWIFEDETTWKPWTLEDAQAEWLRSVPQADLSQYWFEQP